MSNVIIGGISGDNATFSICFCRNATWKSGDPSSDKQQPLNPIAETAGIKFPERVYELIAPVSDLYPQIEVDKNLEPSTITLRMLFREPFLLLTLFSYKALPSSWTGTSDTITANFSSRANIDNNIAIQLRLPDPSGGGAHVDLLFDGGRIEEYRWIGEESGIVHEEVDIKFAEISENTQALTMDSGFHDSSFGSNSGWALWNTSLYADKKLVLLTKDVTVTINNVAPVGIQMQSWELVLSTPHVMEFVASSQVAGIVYEEVRGPWQLTLNGKLSGNDAISEAIATLATKTKATAKLQYDASPFSKYIQFTNSVLKNIEGLSIPRAGETIDVSYVYEGAGGSVLSYSWTDTEGHDPSAHINHTDV